MKVRGQTVFSPSERLKRLSEIDAITGCWNWISTTRNGYGRLVVGSRTDKTRRSVSAHRLSYETFNGPVPAGLEVCHSCDNPRCVNPAHLFAGTRQVNVDDREKKGRGRYLRGEENGMAKLNDADVLSAKRLRNAGATYQSIADRFGVDKMTVMHAIKGQSWTHVPAPPASGAFPTAHPEVLPVSKGQMNENSSCPSGSKEERK